MARATDPGVNVQDPQVREAWLELGHERLVELCETSYNSGDFGYVSTALKANHESMRQIMGTVAERADRHMNDREAFDMMRISFKTNALLLTLVNRHAHVEAEMAEVQKQVKNNEENMGKQEAMTTQIMALAEGISNIKGGTGNKFSKPVSEFKAIQQLKPFNGDRSKFREWNDKLINALAQVKPCYRVAIKNLNTKLENMEGVLDDDEEDLIRILNNRLTVEERKKAMMPVIEADDAKGDYEVDVGDVLRLDEDLWYVLKD